ncbi:hypothetical protein [Coleofasciculus sp. FACHB-SPT9]|nr:hypothetical protein [Coleofasciculus sp. FACHB-SPT9]MBD1890257.1 hypothetical protein [Coleofasciculus sp. FACHB-SPT9]
MLPYLFESILAKAVAHRSISLQSCLIGSWVNRRSHQSYFSMRVKAIAFP